MVVGGTGFFGGAAVELLREAGIHPVVASRRGGAGGRTGIVLDAEDADSLRAGLRPGDVLLDAAGPFQSRSALLVRTALDTGCDVIDLSDSLDHVLRVEALRPEIEAAGIRVLTSCSSVTAVVAMLLRDGVMRDPVRVSVFLAPASRETARPGTSGSLRHSLGRPIRVWRDGRLVPAVGWGDSRPFRMPDPIGAARGYLMESVLAATLPRLWPGLREADFWVDSRVPGMNRVFAAAVRLPPLAAAIRRSGRGGLIVARCLGSTSGGMLVEAEDAGGTIGRSRLWARRRSYLAAVAPAVLAARAVAEGRMPERGLVPHDRQVSAAELFPFLDRLGIERTSGTRTIPGDR